MQGNRENKACRDKGGGDQFEGESAHDVILHGYGLQGARGCPRAG
jgi:hypothetical protein